MSGFRARVRPDGRGGFVSHEALDPRIDADTVRRLLRHEAQVHAIPGRTLRDLGDALLLFDAQEPEPFWNRLEAIRWPSESAAFDRRLAEIGVLFASIARQPHVWTSPPHDEPVDLVARLRTNGFENVGEGLLLVARDGELARDAMRRPPGAEVTLERLQGSTGPEGAAAADAIVTVLLEAFGVDDARRPGVVAETLVSLADPRFTHYLVRRDAHPVAAARRATFDGLSYLSSIGTVVAARGLGLGRYVTAVAMVDSVAAGSEWIHLGVFADNVPARRLYERLGFVLSGYPGPDMILTG